MAASENDEAPMLHSQFSYQYADSQFQKFESISLDVPSSISTSSMGSNATETELGDHSSPFMHACVPFQHLRVCKDSYCTICSTRQSLKSAKQENRKASRLFNSKIHISFYDDAKGWFRRCFSFLNQRIPGVMSPHTKGVQQWNKFFVLACLVAIFIDPLFFFVLSAWKEYKCLVISKPLTTIMVFFRTVTDLIYFLHMLLQFRLAYVAPESRVVGAGEIVDQPKKIALHYLQGKFLVDLFIVLPLPQIIILAILPQFFGSSGANDAKNLLRMAVLFQYIPRLYRFLPLLAGQSPYGFVLESARTNFIINLLTFMLAGHVVGSCWYLFGLQRVNQCLRNACHNSDIPNELCMKFIDCGFGEQGWKWENWIDNENATTCFSEEGFAYGIYVKAVDLTTADSVITKYVYSLFWGFQQISTLAGNQVPSYFVWEVLFTMAIIGLGLLLFALLIGNMQNFLQSLGRRRFEMLLRRRDVEWWMSYRHLPEELRRQVRQAERYNWSATRGVNEEMLLENLPEDLQRDIRRHLFKFVKKVRIFTLLEDPVLDAICEKLKQKTYIKGSKIFYPGGLVEKMVFIVRGRVESIGEDGIVVSLCEGDVCGEELLTWCLEHPSVNNVRIPGRKLLSNRMVRCLSNVEAFSLRAADLEEFTSRFARFLRNARVQGAIRYESPYWRGLAAKRIQVAWRYRKKRLSRASVSQNSSRLHRTFWSNIG
ncbi:hypothetical protein C1H46_020523 [Malus baccata]|uniref:Cyclic nucleotide-binding domain-containing protein n=1 Tax=Malus baccata TaxID=106549 RepID=A0A540M532_MALBA|nr:hypothetical protein C1H46_020523 [Malus baccata]